MFTFFVINDRPYEIIMFCKKLYITYFTERFSKFVNMKI